MSFNVSEEKERVSPTKKIWNEAESQLFEKVATEHLKREGRYVYGKFKTWKEHIKTNFHGQDIPYDMYCNETTVLKILILSTNKVKHILFKYMLKSVNTPLQKTNNAAC